VLAEVKAAPSYARAGPKVRKALLEAALVESNLSTPNQAQSDRDSEGVLQQRPSQGWGPTSESNTTDAEQFLRRAMAVANKYGNAGELAQAVQRSAYPGRYNQRGGEAQALIGGGASGRSSGNASAGTVRGGGTSTSRSVTTTTTTPGVDNRMARLSLVQSFLDDKNANPVDFAMQARGLQDVAPTSTTKTVRLPTTTTGAAGATPHERGANAGGGAARALSWAESKLSDPGARETGGANRGRLPDYLNARFGFGASGGQPWCAMFTSAAVTKGGAPPSARTASVAQVRQKAQAGQGYVRGFIPGDQARPGDLILFGNAHIGMVRSVRGGRITYVGGNQSNRVSQGSAAARGATIVRPKYGARR
jgi:hypothetical protein